MVCQSSTTQFSSPKDCEQLYQCLDFCRQQSIADNQPKIASIAFALEALDPLAAMQQLATADQLSFYIENRDEGTAIAAINATLSHAVEGANRFSTAQKFIQESFQGLIPIGSQDYAWLAPRFFCSFTFSDRSDAKSLFPSALLFLPQWQLMRRHHQSAAVANYRVHAQSNLDRLTDTIWQQFQAIYLAQYDRLHFSERLPTAHYPHEMVDIHNFHAAVLSALDSIHHHQFDKLVLAHAIDVVSQRPFQWVRSLHHLRQMHPDCWVFLSSNGRGQRFLGASPERLLSIRNHGLVTDALAGSAPRGRTVLEDTEQAQQLFNSTKERHEHQVVVDFIAHQLSHLGLTPSFQLTPGLLQLSNIQHLHTPIHATVPPHIHPLQILADLHPTPAVAGMPRDIACEQILRYEPFGRSLYAAPLGWVDAQDNAEFVVGIRSAALDGNHARLYAGAGIVAGSDPDREVAEIGLKFQALLKALV